MATFLYRIGRFSFRRRWLVLGLWVLLLALIGVGAATLSGKTSNSFSTRAPRPSRPSTSSRERFPQANAGGAHGPGRVRRARGADGDRPGQPGRDRHRSCAALRGAPQVAGVVDPYEAQVHLPMTAGTRSRRSATRCRALELTDADREALSRHRRCRPRRRPDRRIRRRRPAGQPAETGIVEVLGIAIAALVLIITLGSLVAAGLPLLTALVGVGVGLAGLLIVSGFVDINANSLILALMLGVAVGIDYALFIVSRYRHETPDRPRRRGSRRTRRRHRRLRGRLRRPDRRHRAGRAHRGRHPAAGRHGPGRRRHRRDRGAGRPHPAAGPARHRRSPRRRQAAPAGARDPEADTGPVPMGERWARFVIPLPLVRS